MCGPSEDYSNYYDKLIHCDFCKVSMFRKDSISIARALPPYGQFFYVNLCDQCYKPFAPKEVAK